MKIKVFWRKVEPYAYCWHAGWLHWMRAGNDLGQLIDKLRSDYQSDPSVAA